MFFVRLSLCAAVLSLGNCSLFTAPDPPEFKPAAETLSAANTPPAGRATPENVDISLALTPTFAAVKAPAPPPPLPNEPVKVKPKRMAKAKARPGASAPKSSHSQPAAKPRDAPAVDRSHLLNLMREPTER